MLNTDEIFGVEGQDNSVWSTMSQELAMDYIQDLKNNKGLNVQELEDAFCKYDDQYNAAQDDMEMNEGF